MDFKILILVLFASIGPINVSARRVSVYDLEQFTFAMTTPMPGDIISIEAKIGVGINGVVYTGATGTPDLPIIVEAIGDGEIESYMPPGSTRSLISVNHNNWIFRNISFSGRYIAAIVVESANVTIQNCEFDATESSYAAIASNGQNTIIEASTFFVMSTGVIVMPNHPGRIPVDAVIRNCLFHARSQNEAPDAISLAQATVTVENNRFLTDNITVFWYAFVRAFDSQVTIRNNRGVRAYHSGYYVTSSYHDPIIPIQDQYYHFYDNHCNLWFWAYCIEVAKDFLYDKTIVDPSNTYENGRGLTNLPTKSV